MSDNYHDVMKCIEGKAYVPKEWFNRLRFLLDTQVEEVARLTYELEERDKIIRAYVINTVTYGLYREVYNECAEIVKEDKI